MKISTSEIRCAVISIFSFPIGLAPTNRIIAYSKGMVENGAHVEIIIPFPTDKYTKSSISSLAEEDQGKYQGLLYYYTSGRYKSRYKFLRALAISLGIRRIRGYVSSCSYLIRQNRKTRYKCIIISSDSPLTLFVYSILSKAIDAKSIFIFDEYPIPIRHKLRTEIPRWKEYLYRKILKNIDAYISISNKLAYYFNKLYDHNTFILPIIVDSSRFDFYSTDTRILKDPNEKYLCYMGNMELTKDDVVNIINAFSLISDKYKALKLYLYGPLLSATAQFLHDMIHALNLQDRVLLKGLVKSDEVPKVLMNAYILVSSQPDTIRASGGFPTKLGEYLISGVPTLMTDVGENSKYVKDGIHLFFSSPGKPEMYANKLTQIIDNYVDAKRIAMNGKRFVLDNFSHFKVGYDLVEFIKGI